jgi:hypothetical protein
MDVCVCVCVCVWCVCVLNMRVLEMQYIFMHVCMYACMYECINTFVHTHTHTHTHNFPRFAWRSLSFGPFSPHTLLVLYSYFTNNLLIFLLILYSIPHTHTHTQLSEICMEKPFIWSSLPAYFTRTLLVLYS